MCTIDPGRRLMAGAAVVLLASCLAGCDDEAGALDGSTRGDAAPLADAAPMDGGPSPLPMGLGTPCERNADCPSGVCLPISGTGEGARCTIRCDAVTECPSGWSCAAIGGIDGDVCQCSPTGEEQCNGVDDDCDGYVDEGSGEAVGCTGDFVCVDGTCSCPPSRLCGSPAECVDLQSDPRHCGACGRACPAACSRGACVNATRITTSGTSCAVLEDGALRCWGANTTGSVGDGTLEDRLRPVAVTALSEVVDVQAGGGYACALLDDRSVWCWGRNANGELGRETTETFVTMPAEVSGLRDAVTLAVGGGHVCTLRSIGSIVCWGSNTSGQLGDGGTTSRARFESVPGLAGVTSVATGAFHTCAVLDDGTVWCWGYNNMGQVQPAEATNVLPSPVRVEGISGATAVAAGSYHTCALLASGSVACWGDGREGQIGEGTLGGNHVRPTAVSGLDDVQTIAASSTRSCALTSDGTVYCWGSNMLGELGDGTSTARPEPTEILTEVADLGIGGRNGCALRIDGAVQCWGYNMAGAVGDGTTTDRLSPTPVRW